MNAKYWAFICVCVLSSEIVSATFFWPRPHRGWGGGGGGGRKHGQCRCNSRIKKVFERKLVSIKSSLRQSYNLQEESASEYSFREGRVENFRKLRIDNYGCSVGRNYIRIYWYLTIVDVLLHYKLYYLERVHHNILGSILSGLFRLLGKVVGFLLSVCLDVNIVVVLRQDGFDGRSRLVLESIDYDGFHNIRLKNHKLRHHEEILSHIKLVVLRGIKLVIESHFKKHVSRHCSEVTVRESDFYYREEEEYEESSSYESREYDSDDGEHAYVSEESHKKDDSYKKGDSYESNDRYETDGTYVKDDYYEKGDTYKKDKSYKRDDSYEKDDEYERNEEYEEDDSTESGSSYKTTYSYRYEED